ncbi:MAG TPA: ABC transporter permease [Candidatus Sulfotelmatobacter sp.]|nr:ABC transporter permease [Candidatus Sulfotelmatobacter sp.]
MSASSRFLSAARQASVALQETFRIALDTLRAHKLRTFLTLLGVILAVTTLVAVMSVLNGLNVYVADKVANLGANAFVVDRIGIVTNLDEWTKARKRPPLDISDYEALRDGMRLANATAGEQDTTADVRYGNQLSEDVQVIGATPAFTDIREIEVSSGRLFTQSDEDHRAGVCIIGADVANKLFPGVDPVGREIRAGQGQYQIVGVAKPKGTVFGQPLDNFVMIPLKTYRTEWLAPLDSVTIFVQARGPEWVSAAADEARMILRARRHQRYDDEDNFAVILPSSFTSLWNRITGNAFAIAVWVTSVFLVVGGIVIMNIMLASVTERTREIGLRKSLGARRGHIILQFLVESSLLAACGGTVGVAVAVGIAQIVRAATPIPISTPFFAITIALVLSTAVGLFFGIYPAMRAARLDPIDALRAEN